MSRQSENRPRVIVSDSGITKVLEFGLSTIGGECKSAADASMTRLVTPGRRARTRDFVRAAGALGRDEFVRPETGAGAGIDTQLLN